MDTIREEFERVIRPLGFDHLRRLHGSDVYEWPPVQYAWVAWQAARTHYQAGSCEFPFDVVVRLVAAERERCAQLCEDYMKDCLDDRDIQAHWPQTKRMNDLYASVIRSSSPKVTAC